MDYQSSWFQPWPHLVDESLFRLCLFLRPVGIPCPHLQEAEHVQLVDFLHAPPGVQQGVVG